MRVGELDWFPGFGCRPNRVKKKKKCVATPLRMEHETWHTGVRNGINVDANGDWDVKLSVGDQNMEGKK